MGVFRSWYVRNQDAITWFLIGFLLNSGFTALGEGHYFTAVLTFVIAYVNYVLSRIRLQ